MGKLFQFRKRRRSEQAERRAQEQKTWMELQWHDGPLLDPIGPVELDEQIESSFDVWAEI